MLITLQLLAHPIFDYSSFEVFGGPWGHADNKTGNSDEEDYDNGFGRNSHTLKPKSLVDMIK